MGEIFESSIFVRPSGGPKSTQETFLLPTILLLVIFISNGLFSKRYFFIVARARYVINLTTP